MTHVLKLFVREGRSPVKPGRLMGGDRAEVQASRQLAGFIAAAVAQEAIVPARCAGGRASEATCDEGYALNHAASDPRLLAVGLGELSRHRGGAGERAGEGGAGARAGGGAEGEASEDAKGHAVRAGERAGRRWLMGERASAMWSLLLMRSATATARDGGRQAPIGDTPTPGSEGRSGVLRGAAPMTPTSGKTAAIARQDRRSPRSAFAHGARRDLHVFPLAGS